MISEICGHCFISISQPINYLKTQAPHNPINPINLSSTIIALAYNNFIFFISYTNKKICPQIKEINARLHRAGRKICDD